MTRFLRATAAIAVFVAILASPARAASADAVSIFGWPANPRAISEIGRGAAVVFSPDLTVPGNRAFYERLGFIYLESADWADVLEKIRHHNLYSLDKIHVVVLETHGTNGNGLKIQDGHEPGDARSYIAVGALQEMLSDAGVSVCVISACNAGRLFRPGIFTRIDPKTADPLFLPATCGILDSVAATPRPKSRTVLFRRSDSNLETLMDGRLDELDPVSRASFTRSTGDTFVISTMMIQLLLRDPELRLASSGWVEKKSRADLTDAEVESLFQKFAQYVARVAKSTPQQLKTAAR